MTSAEQPTSEQRFDLEAARATCRHVFLCKDCGQRSDVERLERERDEMRAVLAALEDAVTVYEALQDGATDPRVGLTQPITVAEGKALIAALTYARAALAPKEPPDA